VRTHFSECGPILSVRIIRDPHVGLGKGFGYVAFESKECLQNACNLNGTELQNRKLRVFKASKKGNSNKQPTGKSKFSNKRQQKK